ncbi:MAG TPA: metal-dependent hydrolase [Nautiliaceae bacterium]|nr:metal-dependent hydrolase [Nautiliaceae bacterium]
MTLKGHINLAIFPFLLFNNLNPTSNLPIPFYIGLIIGSFFPDIDEPNSYIGKKLSFLSKFLRKIGLKHRTLTHSIFFPFTLFLLIILLSNLNTFFIKGFIVGAIFHIIGDAITISGVPIFYPISKKRYFLLPSFLRFKVGGIAENIIIFILTLTNIVLGIKFFIPYNL